MRRALVPVHPRRCHGRPRTNRLVNGTSGPPARPQNPTQRASIWAAPWALLSALPAFSLAVPGGRGSARRGSAIFGRAPGRRHEGAMTPPSLATSPGAQPAAIVSQPPRQPTAQTRAQTCGPMARQHTIETARYSFLTVIAVLSHALSKRHSQAPPRRRRGARTPPEMANAR